MTRPNITPGPWSLDRAGVNVIDPKEKKEYIIAHCRESRLSIIEANARAIAAVPALLEALEIVDEAFSKLPDYGEAFTRPNGWSVQPMAKVRSALTSAGYQF